MAAGWLPQALTASSAASFLHSCLQLLPANLTPMFRTLPARVVAELPANITHASLANMQTHQVDSRILMFACHASNLQSEPMKLPSPTTTSAVPHLLALFVCAGHARDAASAAG
jgi:hypothetical protein